MKIVPGTVTAKLMPKLWIKEKVPVILAVSVSSRDACAAGRRALRARPVPAASSAWKQTQAAIDELGFSRVKSPRPTTITAKPATARGLYLPKRCRSPR